MKYHIGTYLKKELRRVPRNSPTLPPSRQRDNKTSTILDYLLPWSTFLSSDSSVDHTVTAPCLTTQEQEEMEGGISSKPQGGKKLKPKQAG